jgi:HEAT repeat protein
MKTNAEVEKLIKQLQGKNGSERQRARDELVKIGKPAVPLLVDLLSNRKEHMRWEACKALGSINDPAASDPLVDALRDDSMEIRWLAGEALIALEEKAVIPLLRALEEHFDSVFLLEGTHHVLHALERQKLLNKKARIVLDSLRYLEPKISVAVAAREALQSLA